MKVVEAIGAAAATGVFGGIAGVVFTTQLSPPPVTIADIATGSGIASMLSSTILLVFARYMAEREDR